MKQFLTKITWQKTVIFILVVVAFWLPRRPDLDLFVTHDENLWLVRSGNFIEALTSGDFANTFQKGHPGVTVTWAGAAGYLVNFRNYIDLDAGQREKPQKFIRLLNRYGHKPIELLETGRTIVVLINAFVLSLAYFSAIRLLGFFPASVAFLLIAFDPFGVALSRLLHPDALLGPVMFLSLVAMMNYFFKGNHPVDLILSAIAAGFSWLTKSPSLFLIPFFGLLTVFTIRKLGLQCLNPRSQDFGKLIKPFVIWGGLGALVFFVFWPAMWVNPMGTLNAVFTEALGYAAQGHEYPLFFAGKIYPASISDWRFYLVNYLWRATPVTVIGLVLAGIALLFRRRLTFPEGRQRAVIALLLFAFFFTIFVNMSGKKFDRYLLPVFAPLDIVAALGWVTLVENFFQNRLDWRLSAFRSSPAVWLSSAALILGVIFVQIAAILQTQPYYFTYYNSLLGGIQKASQVMMIGWGEGLDLAAHYLNSKPDATKLSVHSWYEEVFAYSFDGKAVQRSFDPEATELENVDYLVLYVNQWQRELPSPSFLTLFDGQQPEYVVRINEMEYARIYNMKK